MILDPLDIPSRFDELKALKEGWLDGRGRAPDAGGLDWLEGAIERRYAEHLSLPYVYPVAEGGVQLEWPLKPYEASLEIDFESRSGDWHVLNLDTGDEESKSLDLLDDSAWSWLIIRLTEMSGAIPSD
jgi:hypothetical protein